MMNLDEDGETKLTCPFNKSHPVTKKIYNKHLRKCQLSHPHIIVEKCPFNTMHWMHESELEAHKASCPDRRIVESFMYSMQAEVKQERGDPPDAAAAYGSDGENWDNDVTDESYNPELYASSAPILRSNIGNLPSQRKKFTESEIKRHAEFKKGNGIEDKDRVRIVERQTRSILMDEPEPEPVPDPKRIKSENEPRVYPGRNFTNKSDKRHNVSNNLFGNNNQRMPESSNNGSKPSNHHKLDIIHVNHPNEWFSDSELDTIKKTIINKMLDDKEDNSRPQFLSTSIIGGVLSIICFNENTKKWLINIVATIKLGQGFTVRIIEKTELPRKYNCFIYLSPDDYLPKEILIATLIKQNPGIDISKWEYLKGIKTEEGGIDHHFIVNDASKAYLDRNHFHLFLNFSQIIVHFMDSTVKIKAESDKGS